MYKFKALLLEKLHIVSHTFNFRLLSMIFFISHRFWDFLISIQFLFLSDRFGYEYGGGYDREMGGRPGYGDERPHGRFMGRFQGDTSVAQMNVKVERITITTFASCDTCLG